MANEGEYLSMVNDLRDMYNDMKQTLNKDIAYYKERINYLEEELRIRPSYTYTTGQFESDRPLGRCAQYTSGFPFLAFYQCRRCNKTHPHAYVCYT